MHGADRRTLTPGRRLAVWLVVGAATVAGCGTQREPAPARARAVPPVSPSRSPSPFPSPSFAAAPGLDARDWSGVRYPLRCGGVPQQVLDRRFGDVTGDGRVEAVVVVACAAGAGSPPHHVYVYDGASPPGAPRLLSELSAPRMEFFVRPRVSAGTVSGVASGYSSTVVPRCCPDLRFPVAWRWDGTRFTLVR